MSNNILKNNQHTSTSTVTTSGTWDFQDEVVYTNFIEAGIHERVVRQISLANNEPDWMLALRLKALKLYEEKAMPTWGPTLEKLNLDAIYYFAKPQGAGSNKTWEDVPEYIKKTFDRL